MIASKSFEILFGDTLLLNGSQLTVKVGSAFTLNAQMSGNELMFTSIQEGDLYQILPATTGDDSNIALWLILLFLSGGLGYGVYVSNKKKRRCLLWRQRLSYIMEGELLWRSNVW